MTRQLLYYRPVRKEPCLEIVQGDMRMKLGFMTHPLPHRCLGICCRWKIGRLSAGVDVRERDDMVSRPAVVIQQSSYYTL
jgi:hypothetical protein